MQSCSTRSPAAMHIPLVPALLPGQGVLRACVLSWGASWALAALAQLSLPLPFTPVPITGQTLGVLLCGLLLGPRLSALAIVFYWGQGAAGLPVFAGARGGMAVLAGPTAGYLFAFLPAAMLTGWASLRGWDRRPVLTGLALLGGQAVIYIGGLSGLALWTSSVAWPGVALLQQGLLPFLPGDLLKMLLAALLLPSARRVLERYLPQRAHPHGNAGSTKRKSWRQALP